MPPKPVAEASKATMPDMLHRAILNDILQFDVDKSRFAMTGKLLPKRSNIPATELNLFDWAIRLAEPDEPLTSLFHVKRRGELDDPMEQFRSKLKEKENGKKVNLKSEAEVTRAIDTHHSTVHRLCNQIDPIWQRHPYIIDIIADTEAVETIARLIQALYNDELRIRLEVIEDITPQVLLDLSFGNGDISELMSNKPPLKALKDRFSLAQNKVIEAGYQVVVGNEDKFELQLTFGGDISDSEVEEQTNGKATAAKRKRKKHAADSDKDKSGGKSKRARKTKPEPGVQVKTNSVDPSPAPQKNPKTTDRFG